MVDIEHMDGFDTFDIVVWQTGTVSLYIFLS